MENTNPNTNSSTEPESIALSKASNGYQYMKLKKWNECREFEIWIGTVNPNTQRTYTENMGYFVNWSQSTKHPIGMINELIEHPKEILNEILEDYMVYLKKRGLSRNTVKLYMAGIESFLIFHEVSYSEKKIKRLLPPRQKLAGKNAYKLEQIQAMLDSTSILRMKVIVMLSACSGVRKGGLAHLKVGDLVPIENCYAIKVYNGEIEEYITFCTPETRTVIDQYFEWRKDGGEVITPESMLLQMDSTTPRTGPNAGRDQIIAHALFMLLRKAGIKKERVGKNRYNISMAHGFRKFFNTQLNIAHVDHNAIEKMMGHKNGLKGGYNDAEIPNLFEEYKKAIPNLTLLEKNRQKAIIDELKSRSVRDEVMLTKEVIDMKQKMERIERELELHRNAVTF
ncbi:tyrosine-type recombinase/integrase [Candidatus Nitrosopumilus sediminis]|uniref:Integrase family protein n=1 Tax=Candidatus Nitrosopumilus sediminis TaxID=1229909 RepID=K0BD62_9ARCH|nr:site-specific integrase [Candidatus Nitrosopumilus sediminis]AFS83002.1 integrase family protein [Candidatus Nitrosopumilus sediminis]